MPSFAVPCALYGLALLDRLRWVVYGVRWMVPFRGRGTSLEPSVMEPGEVDRSLANAVVAGARVSPLVVVVKSIDSCLGGNAGG